MKQVMVIVRLDTLVNLSYFEDQKNVRLYKGNIKGTHTVLYRQKKKLCSVRLCLSLTLNLITAY